MTEFRTTNRPEAPKQTAAELAAYKAKLVDRMLPRRRRELEGLTVEQLEGLCGIHAQHEQRQDAAKGGHMPTRSLAQQLGKKAAQ